MGAMEADIRVAVVISASWFTCWALYAQAAPHPSGRMSARQAGRCLTERAAQDGGSGWRSLPCNERWGHCYLPNCCLALNNNPYRDAASLMAPEGKSRIDGAHQPLGLVRHGAAVEWGP
jgi:hypothetical protein